MIINRKEVLKTILDQKTKELEEKDFEILKTREKKYIPVRIIGRNITTEFGPLNYKRRIYKYHDERTKRWKYVALLDRELGIKKWQKLDSDLVRKIEKEIVSNKRYRDIVDMFGDIQLSQMTISNIFKRMVVSNYLNVEKIELSKDQIVYINLDDTFPKVRKGKKKIKLRTRIITFNLGLNNETKRLINKRFAFLLGNTDARYVAQQITKMGNQFFKNFDCCKLVIGGDGANWIKAAADLLGAHYVLDKYHAHKVLKDAFKINWHNPKRNLKDWNLFNNARTFFKAGNYEALIKVVDISKSKVAKNYFRLNKDGVISYSKSWNIGVSAESDVSKLVKSTYGYGSKIYSYQVFEKILIQKAYSFNQI